MKRLSPVVLQPLTDVPLVSVLMSSYNYARFIGEAIESVLNQTWTRFEFIVCDDGSSDESCDVIEHYVVRDSRVKLIRKSNGGQASGYNAAFLASHGEVICFIDADDTYRPNKLQRIVDAFRAHPEAGFAGHKLIRVDEQRHVLGMTPIIGRMPSGWQCENTLENAGLLPYLAPGGGLSLRREVAELIFPLPECTLMTRYGDRGPMRLAPLITPLIAVEEGLAEWRCHGSNFGHRRALEAPYIRQELQSYRSFWQLQRDFLEKQCPAAVTDLTPLETNVHVLEMQYILARLENSSAQWAWWRIIRNHNASRQNDLIMRCFWFSTIFLSRRVFAGVINAIMGPHPAKAALTRVSRLLCVRRKRLSQLLPLKTKG